MSLDTSFALSFQGRRCLSPDQHMLTQTQHSSGQLASYIPFPKFEPARKSFQGK